MDGPGANYAHPADRQHWNTLVTALCASKHKRNPGLMTCESVELTSASESLYGGQFTLSTQLIKANYLAD